jgi:hypothetical protein
VKFQSVIMSSVMKLKCRSLLVLALLSPFALLSAGAEPIVVSPNETVLFDETFTDNNNLWTNVAVINGGGVVTTGQADISNGVWKPSIEADHKGVSSVIDTDFDLSAGSVSIYYDVAVGADRSGPGGRFGIRLDEQSSHKRFVCHIYPGNTGVFQYISNGSKTDLELASSSGIVTSGSFSTFKVTISAPNGVGAPGRVEVFYYDYLSASYLSLGVAEDVDLGDGVLDRLLIFSRNGRGADTAARFSQIVVTQATGQ